MQITKKRHFTPLDLWQMKIKTTLGCHLISLRMATIKTNNKKQNKNKIIRMLLEELELSCVVGGNVNCGSCWKTSMVVPQKIESGIIK